MNESLRDYLGKQFLITVFAYEKLQIVNFIKEGYDHNKPILINNRFLHHAAHIYYRSIIIDLYSLFGSANNHNKNSFKFIIDRFQSELKEGCDEIVKQWMTEAEEDIRVITHLRHEKMAHFDFHAKANIDLDFDSLLILNKLIKIAQDIISHYGYSICQEEERMGFDFDLHNQELESLKRLIDPVQS